jgi:molybdopterin-synthase adenylyltransferase
MSRHVIAFPAGGVGKVRETLLADVPLESAQFLFARPIRTPLGVWRLIVCDSLEIDNRDYLLRTEVALDVAPRAVAAAMQRARAEGLSIIVAHSHPLAHVVLPSDRDRAGEALLLEAFRRRIPDVPHARMIVGPDALNAALFGPQADESPVSVIEVGSELTTFRLDHGRELNDLESTGTGHFDRQVKAFGAEGQLTLGALNVAIVGLGGTGSVVAQQLAHLGISHFMLIDPDTVEATNLNRVVGTHGRDDVGRAKVDVASEMISSINSSASVQALRSDVRDSSTARRILDADVFFACTDSHGSRAVLAQLAYQYWLPGFDIGVAIHVEDGSVTHVSGRVQMLAPSLPCLLCGGVLDPEAVRQDLLSDRARALDHYIVGAPTPQPAVISVNSTASSLAVTMFLSATVGVPFAARHIRLRLESGVTSRVEVTAHPECPVCSAHGTLGRGDSWSSPGRNQ